MNRRNASILVGLLWCVAILSIVVVTLLHTARTDLRIAKNHGDALQAHYLALAGIEKARALLHQDATARKRRSSNHSGDLYDNPREFRDIPLGRGRFQVIRSEAAPGPASGSLIHGIQDEESRLNINLVPPEELLRLQGMTPEVAAAIVDWRDGDNTVSNGGAEADHYLALPSPYLPRNAPFTSIAELLLVRGIEPNLLRGEDANFNELLDPEEDDGTESSPADNQDGQLDDGWSRFLTIHSAVRNVTAAGQKRVHLKSADEAALTGVRGITQEIAKAIVASRANKTFDSIFDLLDVTPPPPPGQSQPRSSTQPPGIPAQGIVTDDPGNAPSPPANPNPTGPRLISEELLMEIADDVSASDDDTLQGPVNVNTASTTVLACLPGMTRELATAIVNHRGSSGFFPNIAWLLKVPGMNRQILQRLAPRLTTRSETFRILAEGNIPSTGTRRRIETIVRLTDTDVETLAWRENL